MVRDELNIESNFITQMCNADKNYKCGVLFFIALFTIKPNEK